MHRVAILSGLRGEAADRIAISLRSHQVDTVLVRASAHTNDYVKRLQDRLKFIGLEKANFSSKTLAILFSNYTDMSDLEYEFKFFFPIVRRVQLESKTANDPNKTGQTIALMLSHYNHRLTDEISREFKKPIDDRLLLSVKNCKSRKIVQEMDSIYNFRSGGFSSSLDKEAQRVRSSKSIKVGDLNFKPVQNNDRHPVRKCSDSVYCDLASRMRFGFIISERFEFDVTCDSGLTRKKFYFCDGSPKEISSIADHLNMRINDDFREARK